jgi:predicted cobalt transporter CbtA
MVGVLLLRGMLVGVVAGILCFGFLKIAGEPSVNRAIAFETQLEEAKAHADAHSHGPAAPHGTAASTEASYPELVSRGVQAGLGLFTGVAVYSAAFGGLFALAFAFFYGRIGDFGPRATAALLAGMGIVAVYIVPNLKYPANPPSVGDGETIGLRTALYFGIVAVSLATMIVAGLLRSRLSSRYGTWNAFLIAAAAYLIAMLAVGLALPTVDEVPAQFPAVVLWQFRIASLGAQAIMWATLGLVFGALTERSVIGRGRPQVKAAAV